MNFQKYLPVTVLLLSALACGLPSAAPAEPTVDALPPTPDIPFSASLVPPTIQAESTFNVNVPATACWVNSNVTVSSGQAVSITVSGTINTWSGNQISFNDPGGQAENICLDAKCPIEGIGYGALIGRLEDEKPFLVGTALDFTASKDGQLFFTANDWECSDNSGAFELVISIK